MRILIAYASRYGATREIAERIAAKLEDSGLAAEARDVADTGDLAAYDAFVIGSAVYIGSCLKPAVDFIHRNAALLAARPTWIFASGPLGTDSVDSEGRDIFESAQPKEFAEFRGLVNPRALKVFRGAFAKEHLHLGDRLMASMPALKKLFIEGDFREWESIEAWAEEIAHEVGVPEPAVL